MSYFLILCRLFVHSEQVNVYLFWAYAMRRDRPCVIGGPARGAARCLLHLRVHLCHIFRLNQTFPQLAPHRDMNLSSTRILLCADDDPQNSPKVPQHRNRRWGGRLHHLSLITGQQGGDVAVMEDDLGTIVVCQCWQYGYMGTVPPYVVSV